MLYLLVAVLLVFTKAQHRYKGILVGACTLMAAWSSAIVILPFDVLGIKSAQILVLTLEQLRSLGWIAVVAYTLFVAYPKAVKPALAATYAVVLLSCVAYLQWQVISGTQIVEGLLGLQISAFAAIIVAIAGLAIVENLYRNAGREGRWALKYLCFAVGGIFGYDLILQARFALFGGFGEGLYAARGIVDAMMAPLVVVAAARSKHWPIDLHVSRRIVFHSATIVVAAVYLIGVSAVGYYMRLLESTWGSVARIGFIAAAVLALAAALASASMQVRIKNFVAQNFFTLRYDYRQEWLNFIDVISGNLAEISIPERIVRALANLLDCTAGAIWTYVEEDGSYRQSAAWNISNLSPNVRVNEPLPAMLSTNVGIIDVKNGQVDGRVVTGFELPEWLRSHPRAWLVVPLSHSTGLRGFVVLGRPRADRDLNWEDFELLKTAGRQAASYIAEDQAAVSLIKARRFEDFNRQFAFVVHDIKNLAGQMSLILKNAERHGGNPQFQKDVLATVADSLSRMQALLAQLKQRRMDPSPANRVELVSLIERLKTAWRLQIPNLDIQMTLRGAEVVADEQRIEAVLKHLVQNAAEAAGPQGYVKVGLGLEARPPGADSPAAGSWVTVEIADNGPGMDETFIKEKLFQPLSSTKSAGLGIGAYQVMCFVREMGGDIEVKSTVGQGTKMIVRLPQAPMSGGAPQDLTAAIPQQAS